MEPEDKENPTPPRVRESERSGKGPETGLYSLEQFSVSTVIS